jgi:DNA topoisomerase VI subunit B
MTASDSTTKPILNRQVSTFSREMEYFSEAELSKQTGQPRDRWYPDVCAKELIDNALDACEGFITPRITIDFTDQDLTVSDNGPGIPASLVKRTLDYRTRTTDKLAYVSPTRGAQGNALKTVLAIPFVLAGNKEAVIEIEAQGLRHRIVITTDPIAARPVLRDETSEIVKTQGTKVRVSACLKDRDRALRFLQKLVLDYSLFNPHATFILNGGGHGALDPCWHKWQTNEPTSAHWYDVERLEALLGSYLTAERGRKNKRTVREFVSEFRGLSGTAKQTRVTDATGLGRAYLGDLVVDGRFDRDLTSRLLEAMQAESRPVPPEGLGKLGEDHFRKILTAEGKGDEKTFRYAVVKGCDQAGLPYLAEVAFSMLSKGSPLRGLHAGLNWAVPLGDPLQANEFNVDGKNAVMGMQALLYKQQIDIRWDEVSLLMHLASPRFRFLDRGKGSVSL